MAVNTKAIKRRLRSIGNIGKITKAMELVSAAKMKRAVDAALNTRTYATLAWNLLINLSKSVKENVPLLQARPVKKVLVVLITSNRGLCGSFNSSIIKKTAKLLSEKELLGNSNVEVEVIGIGKKGAEFAKKNNYNLVASFGESSNIPKMSDISPISKIIIESFIEQKYDKVILAYTDFKSSLSQIAVLRQLLPISQKDLEETINALGADESSNNSEVLTENDLADYLFEPGKEEVLKIVLPRLVDVQLYQAVLESSASEHSARMMAMKSANEAADDMTKELNLSFNKVRQASITQEIAEIAGGSAALE
ncbi:MAG: ATP synthase F1 subunit gamma [Candidatus Magasanikbacteria bacterium CG_4_9_14_3_um_filter_32_9]|uniref:ATP synthase gamma chain n=1 Tax=Candidatus Magasanikbacteria bacterium CG_4_9_14_3_um_filter_32_9 TaxID=1974644 RepID=A0A2M7Z7G4_9BACT|nr:MAG: ATP synthase F1 subunit gamma [Candidatus Magasanikbacteria bacterium CG_4_9_14_3_um_filter_32_9]